MGWGAIKRAAAAALTVLALAACGSDKPAEIIVSDGTRSDAVNGARALGTIQTGATLTVDQGLAGMATVIAATNGVAEAGALGPVLDFIGVPSSTWGNASVCAGAAPGEISFTSCDDAGDMINGSISIAPGRYDANLTAAADFGVSAYQASLQMTATHITGTGHLTTDGSSLGGNNIEDHFLLDVVIDIGLDGAGCPTSGSISYVAKQSGTTTDAVEVDFGPACGAAKFYP